MTATPAPPVPPDGPHRRPLPVLVRDVMTAPAVAVVPAATVSEIACVMLEQDIRSVPVVDVGDVVIGMVGEGDLVSRSSYPAARSHDVVTAIEDRLVEHRHHWSARAGGLTAGEIMSPEVISCRPEEPVSVVTRRMLSREVRSLPVIDGGRLVGMVSLHDMVSLLDRSDPEIRAEVQELLADTLYAPESHRVEATVADGVVVLAGTVRYPQDAAVVTALVRQLPGVVEVVDRMEARESDPVFHFPHDTDWR